MEGRINVLIKVWWVRCGWRGRRRGRGEASKLLGQALRVRVRFCLPSHGKNLLTGAQQMPAV